MYIHHPYDSLELSTIMNKMYPDTPYQDKYLLFLQCDLYWKYTIQEISCSIKFETINGTEIVIPDTKIRRPYPNKNVLQLSMKKKRSYCNYGVIIPFDNYKDLTNICEIQVKWDIAFKSKQENIIKHVLISTHKTSFKADKNKRLYGIKCDEYTMFANDEILSNNPEETFLDGYDIYICCNEGETLGVGQCAENEIDEKISIVTREVEENERRFDKVSVDYYERTLEIKSFQI